MVARSIVELRGSEEEENGIIQQRLPDNNAGEITAKDVRDSMVDIVDSIVKVVSEGNFEANPFLNNVEIKRNSTTGTGGILICSGIKFAGSDSIQTSAISIENIPHSGLKFLLQDDHPQYLKTDGLRIPSGDIPMGNKWINSSGAIYSLNRGFHGLQFTQTSSSTTDINVGSGTRFNFFKDSSKMNSSRGVAKAWINFDATTDPLTVKDAYNVSGITKLDRGTFQITFNSGILKDNNYVAIGHSNALDTANNSTSYRDNTVGLVARLGDDVTNLRSIIFDVTDDNNDHVNAKLNDLVIFGTEPTGSGYASSVNVY